MKKPLILALVALLAGFQIMTAIPARPGKTVYVQPDGSKIVLQNHGDEFAHWLTDDAGRLVTQSPDGYFRPATGISFDEILRQGAERRAAARRNLAARRRASSSPVAIGQKHFLVILVEFTNKQFKAGEQTQADFIALLNQQGYSRNGATGSARDYYYENSHGLFEPIFDVYGPVRLDTTYAYYGKNTTSGDDERAEQAVIDGCKKLDEEIDFTRYDNDGDGVVDLVFMYYAGKGENDGGAATTIWPHQWEISSAGKSLTLDGMKIDSYACTSELDGYDQMCAIGTACHEFGHAMGLPDFYDVDYGSHGQDAALFFFSLMCDGAYNNESRTPPYFNMEERILLGWQEEANAYREFSGTGSYVIPSIDENVAYKTPTDKDGEYFVYECRGSNGWDAGLDAHGLVVYHVDKSDNKVGNTTARGLWDNWHYSNSINRYGDHPCFYVIPAPDQSNLRYGYNSMYMGNYYFDYSYSDRIPFPGSMKVTEYVPKSWSGVDGDFTFRDIAYANDQVTLYAMAPYDGLDYCTIADTGSYRAGDRFTFSLVHPENVAAPTSVVWYFDDEPAGADSVTLTAGDHTVEARLGYEDGRQEILTLEIEVM